MKNMVKNEIVLHDPYSDARWTGAQEGCLSMDFIFV